MAAALSLGLTAACAGDGSAEGQKPVQQARQGAVEPVTLKYWTSFPPEPALKETIAAFERATPGIKVELRGFKAADYAKRLPEALGADGEALDVVGVQVPTMTDEIKDRLLPVDEWDNLSEDWRDTLGETAVGQAEKAAEDGKLYSVPMGSSGGAVMYYNAALLSELGMSFPETVADLESVVMKAKKLPDLQPIVLSGEPRRQEELLFTIVGQSDPGLSDDLFAGDKRWNSPEMVSALVAYKSLFDRGVVDKSVLSLKGDGPAKLFTSGKALFLVDDSGRSPLLSDSYRKDNKVSLTDVGAGAFPVLLPGGKPAVRSQVEEGLGIPKDSKHAAEAAELIKFLTLGDGVAKWSKNMTLVPALKDFQMDPSVFSTDAAREGYAEVQEVIGAGGSARTSSRAFLDEVEGDVILGVARGRLSPEKAADQLQKEWSSGRFDLG
ncbi:ABC transporter substrate-binding protein [Streptosporangium lutulentum]|uniref:Raffinose/stachyose/melibiose transport system substrate-binding protein n=1 Tax=Streptosporangium lutulentum TaxID=1461250 RepID=A0ABT9QNX2_9ACTN|nr:extracellular solute-binding protein [Streptosporangium lutulentum]MDP9848061.1 raffinose/stachyose/melibiose transport system substrate-binding protein [Streptosporangium lutulentum]